MADENQKTEEQENAGGENQQADSTTNTDSSSDTQPDVNEMAAKLRKYEFKERLQEVSKTFPHALEFADAIGELVTEKGYSIEDASLVVLTKENKAQTAEQIARSQNTNRDRSSGLGGSMDMPPPRDKKEPQPGEEGAVGYWADKFKELERKGEIRIV